MPLFFKFVSRADGKPVPLNTIDEMICKELAIPCSSTNYSVEFQMISSIGDAVWATGEWNQKIFDKLVGKDDRLRDMVMKYINGEYVYECWASRAASR